MAKNIQESIIQDSLNELGEKKQVESPLKKRTINLGFINLEETIIEDEREFRKSEISINNTIFGTEIQYDEGRDSFLASFTHEGKRTSLSFFNQRIVAYKAIIKSICSLVGLQINNVNVKL